MRNIRIMVIAVCFAMALAMVGTSELVADPVPVPVHPAPWGPLKITEVFVDSESGAITIMGMTSTSGRALWRSRSAISAYSQSWWDTPPMR